jgi:hypothetical protein
MSSSETPRPAKKSVPVLAVMIGLVVLPVTAAVAYGMGVGRPSAQQTTSSTLTPVVATAPAPIDNAALDMAKACGPAGRRLVKGERRGTLSDVQQAALDSLREICAENGYELPARKDKPPTTQTVVIAQAAPTTTTTTPTTSSTWDDDDHHEDDQWDDDDHWEDSEWEGD